MEYLMVDKSDAYNTQVTKYAAEHKQVMLDRLADKDLDHVHVYKVVGEIRLTKRVVVEPANSVD